MKHRLGLPATDSKHLKGAKNAEEIVHLVYDAEVLEVDFPTKERPHEFLAFIEHSTYSPTADPVTGERVLKSKQVYSHLFHVLIFAGGAEDPLRNFLIGISEQQTEEKDYYVVVVEKGEEAKDTVFRYGEEE